MRNDIGVQARPAIYRGHTQGCGVAGKPVRWAAALVFAGLSAVGHAGPRVPAEVRWIPSEPGSLSADVTSALSRAVTETPHALLVVHTRAAIEHIPSGEKPRRLGEGEIPVMTEERHIYEAQVLETLRGPSMQRVRYELVVDRGDSISISSRAQIVMLCRGPQGYYGAGVGSTFAATRELVAFARASAKAVGPKSGEFAYCD